MNKIEIKTYKDLKWLYSCLESTEEVEEVSSYLKDNKLTIELIPCRDSQSGWSGENVILEGKDLSGNGYCFNGARLLNHVRKFRKYKEISKTEEYKNYILLSKKYDALYRYLNN